MPKELRGKVVITGEGILNKARREARKQNLKQVNEFSIKGFTSETSYSNTGDRMTMLFPKPQRVKKPKTFIPPSNDVITKGIVKQSYRSDSGYIFVPPNIRYDTFAQPEEEYTVSQPSGITGFSVYNPTTPRRSETTKESISTIANNFKVNVQPSTKPISSSVNNVKIVPTQIPTTTPKTIPRTTPRQTPRVTPRLRDEIIPKQTPKLTPRLTPVLTPQLTPRLTTRLVPTLIPPVVPPLFPFRKPEDNIYGGSTAYTLEVKRFGKYRQVAGGLTRGRALKLGAQTVSRNLGATFRIKPTGTTTERDISCQPSNIIFREFKVQGGRKVATPNTFIQRSTYRLSNPLERREIQIARRGML